jgi:hypothetical protein
MTSTAKTLFQAAYEISPIILQGGIATFAGGYLPITALTAFGDISTLISGDQFFAHYRPMPGGTLEEWQIAEYPFANLTVAANSVIQQPLKISMLMECPAQNGGGYILKQGILTAMKLALDNHILAGGTFTVITPAYTYTNCLLTSLRDVTSPSDKQVQKSFQWDFTQPLLTDSGAKQVLGSLMTKYQNGLPQSAVNLEGSWNSTPATQIAP